MKHEIDNESLSSFLDGELDAAGMERVRVHLSECPDCVGQLESLRRAGGALKAASVRLPERARQAALAAGNRQASASHRGRRVALALAAVILALLVGGIWAKHFLPGMFSQIHGMISGAASSLGQ